MSGAALLLESTPAHELITRARCLRALGRTNAWRGDARSLVEASHLLGRRSRRRAVQLTFLAEVQALLGRDDEAIGSLGEARSIARIHADERILGYAAWTQARVVARRRDVDGTLRWLAEAERHPGDWLDHPTGTQFLAEAAEISAMVGAEQIAEGFLRRAIASTVRLPISTRRTRGGRRS